VTVATERDRAMPAPVKIPKFVLSQKHQESEPV
jgi:hypothetical protein